MTRIIQLFVISAIINAAFAQPEQNEASNWRTYSDMKTVSAAAVINGKLWAATTGGGFSYSTLDSSFKTFQRTDGMQGIELTAITVDNDGKIWFGSNQGVIDVYNPATMKFNSILDIANSDFNSKEINNLSSYGDTIFVSTDYGVSLINSQTLSFIDTYFKYGSFSSNIKVNEVFKSKLIYISSVNGVAIQKEGATNLSAPESWNVYQTANGLPSNEIYKIVSFNGQIIAATDAGLSGFNGNNWSNFLPDLNGEHINDLLVQNNVLYILTDSTIYKYSQNDLENIYQSTIRLSKLAYSESEGILAASNQGIIIIKNDKSIYPNGPFENQFTDITVDNNGVLWAASGTDQHGVGFYKLENNKWQNYNLANTPSIGTNFYFATYAAPDNTVYFGSWGYGFMRVKNGQFQYFNANNTPIVGSDTPGYLVISGFAVDNDNNLWVLNYGSLNKQPLSVLTTDSTWYNFTVAAQNNQYLKGEYGLLVDLYNTKWFYSAANTAEPGVFYFNENGTFDNTSDDISGYITEADGLNDNSVSSMLIDREGSIWIGTGLGINVITNSDAVLSSQNALQISTIYALQGQSVSCMAVDQLDRKWIGTTQGLLLVNSDGSQVLASYNTQNSPLISNSIIAIAIDKNNGRVYVASDEGITSFDTPAIKPADTFTKLFVYPNPYILPNNNNLTIDGLIRDSQIKILTISGKLVDEFSSPGGRIATWNGKDQSGQYVGSGVYLIIASDKEGNNVIAGKVAILKN
jgi:ligand-binding sensor domain-containing protein